MSTFTYVYLVSIIIYKITLFTYVVTHFLFAFLIGFWVWECCFSTEMCLSVVWLHA
jgi:hypothetical protein